MFPRIYRSLCEFERAEFCKLDRLGCTVDRLVDDVLLLELDAKVAPPEVWGEDDMSY